MPEVVAVLYFETYALLAEALKDEQFAPGSVEYARTIALVAAWEAAVDEFGQNVQKVVVYDEDGVVSFQTYETAWDGIAAVDEDGAE
jgi:hypothetical protein